MLETCFNVGIWRKFEEMKGTGELRTPELHVEARRGICFLMCLLFLLRNVILPKNVPWNNLSWNTSQRNHLHHLHLYHSIGVLIHLEVPTICLQRTFPRLESCVDSRIEKGIKTSLRWCQQKNLQVQVPRDFLFHQDTPWMIENKKWTWEDMLS